MSKPFLFPNSKEWGNTVRSIASISEDKADEWARENEARYDQYYRCEFCGHYIDGECHNLLSNYAYEDIDAEEVCDEWVWQDD